VNAAGAISSTGLEAVAQSVVAQAAAAMRDAGPVLAALARDHATRAIVSLARVAR
jgi:hypothetical protein